MASEVELVELFKTILSSKSFSLDESASSDLVGKRIWVALKGLARKNVIKVSKELYMSGSLTLADLRSRTDLSTNVLNHTLQEMKKADLVVLSDGNYSLTLFCRILLDQLNLLRTYLNHQDIDSLFGSDSMFMPLKSNKIDVR
jgi:hypothetical protein